MLIENVVFISKCDEPRWILFFQEPRRIMFQLFQNAVNLDGKHFNCEFSYNII